MLWILLIIGVLIVLGVRLWFYYLDKKVERSIKLFNLTVKNITHIERILGYYLELVKHFEQEQETGDEPRYGSIYLQWAERFTKSHKYYTDYFKREREMVLNKLSSNFDIGVEEDIENLKNLALSVGSPLIQNTLINIMGEHSALHTNKLDMHWLEKKPILFFF